MKVAIPIMLLPVAMVKFVVVVVVYMVFVLTTNTVAIK